MVPFRIHWDTSHIEKGLSALHTYYGGENWQENADRPIKGISEEVAGCSKLRKESARLTWKTVRAEYAVNKPERCESARQLRQ